jgi:hypothetical protein
MIEWNTPRMTRSAVVTAVVLSFASLCAAAAAAPSSHFPLRDGATWKLTDENGLPLVVKASRSGQAYALRGLPGLATVRVRVSGSDVQAWDSKLDRWRPFLRLGAGAGTRYLVDLPGSALWRTVDVKVTSRTATCSDAQGREVRGCIVLDLRSRRPVADAGVERLVFAPGIGLAEVVVQTIAGPRSYTLDGKAPLS